MAKKRETKDQLKKENAELKEAIKHFNPCGDWDDDVHDCEFRHYAIEYGKQLTKAKEIIKGLLELGSIGDGDYTYVAEAEQFLKE